MSEMIKKNVEVHGAQYNHDSRCIVLAVECDKGKFLTQIPVSNLVPNVTNIKSFTKSQMEQITVIFCKEIIGKRINVIFDPDLDEKLRDKYKV